MRTALALVVAAYLVPLVFSVPLMEDDEGLHAAIALYQRPSTWQACRARPKAGSSSCR